MEKTLKDLQELQLEALRKGVNCDIELFINGNKVPDVTVKMYYTVTDPVIDSRSFHTTFSDNEDYRVNNMRMGLAKKFINNIDNEQ